MRYLRGDHESFEADRYDTEKVSPYDAKIKEILEKRQLDACADWKAFGEQLSGCEIPDFNANLYCAEYKQAPTDDKDDTFLGSYIDAALAQKTMVTNQIFQSDNLLAGYSVEYSAIFWPATRWNTARAVSWESGTSYTTLSIKGKRRRHE